MTYEQLLDRAGSIYHIGSGGKKIKKYLIDYASEVDPDHAIIEIGSGWGSGTAYLCLGLLKAKNFTTMIHAYDTWILDKHMTEQVRKRFLTGHEVGNNFYCEFQENLLPFGIKIRPHIGDIKTRGYDPVYQKIGLVVDDICSGRDNTKHMLETFIPYCISGVTLFVLMDYYFYEKKNKFKVYGEKHLKYQNRFFQANPESFQFVRRLPRSRAAVYRYIGKGIDAIKFIEEV